MHGLKPDTSIFLPPNSSPRDYPSTPHLPSSFNTLPQMSTARTSSRSGAAADPHARGRGSCRQGAEGRSEGAEVHASHVPGRSSDTCVDAQGLIAPVCCDPVVGGELGVCGDGRRGIRHSWLGADECFDTIRRFAKWLLLAFWRHHRLIAVAFSHLCLLRMRGTTAQGIDPQSQPSVLVRPRDHGACG